MLGYECPCCGAFIATAKPGMRDCSHCGASAITQRHAQRKAADHITRLESDVEVLREALKPFADAFEVRRQAYIRRHGSNAAVGASNFEAMPDGWPMEKVTFSMGDFRKAREALSRISGEDRT